MAIAIENSFGFKPELIEGADGIFDVALDGELVFSKREHGGFVEMSEIVELLRSRVLELSLR